MAQVRHRSLQPPKNMYFIIGFRQFAISCVRDSLFCFYRLNKLTMAMSGLVFWSTIAGISASMGGPWTCKVKIRSPGESSAGLHSGIPRET